MANPGVRGVLIVEDEQELRSLFAILLEMEGFKVLQAKDGLQGLEMLSADQTSSDVLAGAATASSGSMVSLLAVPSADSIETTSWRMALMGELTRRNRR